MLTRPKNTLIPIINTEDDREKAIRGLSETHGYSIAEVSYVLGVTKRSVYRWIEGKQVNVCNRMGRQRITGREIRKVYFS